MNNTLIIYYSLFGNTENLALEIAIDIMLKIGYKDIKTKTFYTGSKIFMGHDASMFILDSQK